jgi:hypothetical protein
VRLSIPHISGVLGDLLWIFQACKVSTRIQGLTPGDS